MEAFTSSRTCAYCHTQKTWHWNGQKLKDGSKIYTDGTSSRWAGRRCPDCEKARVHKAIRTDKFDKSVILRQFEDKGFQVMSETLPLKVAKDGQTYTVGIKRAFTEGDKIVLEAPIDNEPSDLIALVFESVRICTPEQIAKLGSSINVFADSRTSPQATL